MVSASGPAPRGPRVVFVSYSREDADWLSRLETMLAPVVRERGLELWIDRQIQTGRRWRPEIDRAIARADAALLLVSPTFLASDFIVTQELSALIGRDVPLAPVLVKACLYRYERRLSDVQWAHDPVRDGPLNEAANVERAIVVVCNGLLGLLDDLDDELCWPTGGRDPSDLAAQPAGGTGPGDFDDPTSRRGGMSVPAVAAGDQMGELHGVPDAPAGFVARAELAELRDVLLSEGAGGLAITGGRAFGLHGHGGIGKTVLAAALARDPVVRGAFPDGVFWTTVGEHPDLLAGQLALAQALDVAAGDARSTGDARTQLRAVLADRRCLIVADDVWSAAAAEAFDVSGPSGRVLYTTRDPGALRAVGADVREIDVLTLRAARELLSRLSDTAADQLPADADRVLAATGRVPLALALAGATVGGGGRSWKEVADGLEVAGATFLDHPYANTFKAMDVAIGALDRDLRVAYASLAVFPEDTRVEVAAVQRWWAHRFTFSSERTHALLEQLAAAKLLVLDGDAIEFHDLQRAFLLLHADSVSSLHHDLLAGYRTLLPGPAAPWRAMAPEEPYIWEHLLYHLCAAGDVSGARDVAADLGYLAWRSSRSGPNAAEGDVRRAATLLPDDPGLAWVLRRMSQWGHLLTGHARIGDLAATLALRTSTAPPGVDASGLHALLPARALRARWGLPDAPDALLRVLDNRSIRVLAVAFSRDGRCLASAAGDGTVQLWDPAAGTQIAILEGHDKAVLALAFSADGQVLASAGYDGTMRLWDVGAATQTSVLHVASGMVSALAFSADGRTLASAGHDGPTRLWDTVAVTLTADLEGGARELALSPDGRTLASTGYDGKVQLWDTPSGTQTAVLDCGGYGGSALAFSPDGQTLASTGVDRRLQLWDATTGTRTAAYRVHGRGVREVAFSPDGRTLAGAGRDEMVRLWDVATGAQTAVFEGHHGGMGCNSVAFSPDGRVVASSGEDGMVRLWDAASTQIASDQDHGYIVQAIAFSPDGQTLVSAGGDEMVRLWDAGSGVQTTLYGTSSVRAVAFSPDGGTLASAHGDGAVRLWNATSGAQKAVLAGRRAEVDGGAQTVERFRDGVKVVAFSPDGQTLASGGDDGTVRLWDVTTGVQTAVLERHRGRLVAVAFSPDGRTLASAAANEPTVRVRDMTAGAQRAVLRATSGNVSALAFSPDGTLAIAGTDGMVRLWDATAGIQCAALEGHSSRVEALAFSADGRILASGDRDGTLRLWDASTATQTLAVRLGRGIWALALDAAGGIAIGIHRTLAYLVLLSRSDMSADDT